MVLDGYKTKTREVRPLCLFFLALSLMLALLLVGCEQNGTGVVDVRPDTVDVEPDFVAGQFFYREVQTSSGQLLDVELRIGFGSDLMGPCIIDPDAPATHYSYSNEDYSPLRAATAELNGTRLVFSENRSRLLGEHFQHDYAVFVLPPESDWQYGSGDSLHWSVEVAGFDQGALATRGSARLVEKVAPSLPDPNLVVHPWDQIPLDQDVEAGVEYMYFLYESRDNWDGFSARSTAGVSGTRPETSDDHIRVRSEVHSDTLYLVCWQVVFTYQGGNHYDWYRPQGGYYEWSMPLLVQYD